MKHDTSVDCLYLFGFLHEFLPLAYFFCPLCCSSLHCYSPGGSLGLLCCLLLLCFCLLCGAEITSTGGWGRVSEIQPVKESLTVWWLTFRGKLAR